MSTRGRPMIDEGLRITVGNDVYFQRSNSPRQKSRSPSGDLRNRLVPRSHPGQRGGEYESRQGEYRERIPTQQYSSQGMWSGPPRQWSPGAQKYEKQYREMGGRQMDSQRSPNRLAENRPRYSREQQFFSQESRGRSPNRRYSRSPRGQSSHSPSRRLNRSPYVESPRRSPHSYMQRSPSPSQNSRPRRRSSSGSDGSRSSSLRRSKVRPTKATLGLAEDLLMTMYSGSRGVHDEEKARVHLHPSLDNVPKQEKKKIYQNRDELSHGYMHTSVARDSHTPHSLTKAYDNNPPARKRYDAETMDDEETYLYGDGASESRTKRQYTPEHGRREDDYQRRISDGRKRSPDSYQRMSGARGLSSEPSKKPILKKTARSRSPDPPSEVKEGVQSANNVTPGGFDSKALKNVLKAIGFDFELSKQSLEKAAQDQPFATLMKANEPSKLSENKEPKSKNDNQQTTTNPPAPISVPPQNPITHNYQPANAGVAAVPIYGTEYQINASQIQNAQYVTPQVLPTQTGGGVYIYQPQVSGPPQLVYQQHPITSEAIPLYQNTQQTPAPSNLKVIRPTEQTKVESKSNKTVEEERRARKQRLKYLEIELEKLKRQQLQLVKKKQKQAGIGDQELLRQNSMLQAGVQKQIHEIRLAAEQAAGIESSTDTSDSDSDASEDNTPVYQFVDPGSHICRICNDKNSNLIEYLEHLHTKIHKKQMDPSDKPWMKKVVQKNKKKLPNAISVSLKGAEFLMPVMSFYCKICKEHFTDELKAEDHCFGKSHNQKYKKFCKDHPQYEKVRDVGHAIHKIKKLKEDFAGSQYEKHKEKKEENVLERQYKAKEKQNMADEVYFHEKRPDERVVVDRVSSKGHHAETPMSYKSGTSPKRSFYEAAQYDKPKEERYRKDKSPPSRHSYGENQYHRPTPESESRSKRVSSKRKYEDSPITKHGIREDKKATRHGGRWSPGYDDYERHNSPFNPSNTRPKGRFSSNGSGKSQGLGFAKFTWKRSDKKDPEEQEPPRKSAFKEKPSAPKTPDESTKSPVTKPSGYVPKGKLGLGGKVGNVAPSTQVRSTKPPPTKTVKAPTKVAPPMNAVLAASTRPIASTKPSRPLGIAKPGPEAKKPEPINMPEDDKKEEVKNPTITKQEPPPPGTEEIFVAPDDGNMSDASGISMELASDEET